MKKGILHDREQAAAAFETKARAVITRLKRWPRAPRNEVARHGLLERSSEHRHLVDRERRRRRRRDDNLFADEAPLGAKLVNDVEPVSVRSIGVGDTARRNRARRRRQRLPAVRVSRERDREVVPGDRPPAGLGVGDRRHAALAEFHGDPAIRKPRRRGGGSNGGREDKSGGREHAVIIPVAAI